MVTNYKAMQILITLGTYFNDVIIYISLTTALPYSYDSKQLCNHLIHNHKLPLIAIQWRKVLKVSGADLQS